MTTHSLLRRCFGPRTAAFVLAGLAFVAPAQTPPDQILLKDYRPRSIFKIPETRVEKARYPIIDVHSHNYARTDADVDRWVRTMDQVGVERTIILSGNTGARFDDVFAKYRRHPKHFEVWCGLDYTGFDQPGFGPAAIAELERCHQAGATGVGELSDKGRGLGATSNVLGMHIDDPRMDALLEKCADLRMPVNIHVGEDQWMYEPMNSTNDGLMNAWKWRIAKGPGVLEHDEVIDSLERAVRKHPRTVFIACHLANCCADLDRFGAMLDRYPNLHGDIGARFGELSPVPRTVARFFQRYQDRLLYGTDVDPEPEMYRVTFRLLETTDEHFYPVFFRKYHWPMHAFALPDDVLKKLYRDNALKLLPAGGSAAKSP
ncbi:MAG: amidohydrolase family protein [Verrucomicrobia bacterium]|nr:amidohydrolase family protein [Verrucomicrobiota bacterium]